MTNTKTKYLFGILSVAARKAITKKWLKPGSPSIEDWYDIIYEIFVMERMTVSIRLQKTKFEENWELWKTYISLRQNSHNRDQNKFWSIIVDSRVDISR